MFRIMDSFSWDGLFEFDRNILLSLKQEAATNFKVSASFYLAAAVAEYCSKNKKTYLSTKLLQTTSFITLLTLLSSFKKNPI